MNSSDMGFYGVQQRSNYSNIDTKHIQTDAKQLRLNKLGLLAPHN